MSTIPVPLRKKGAICIYFISSIECGIDSSKETAALSYESDPALDQTPTLTYERAVVLFIDLRIESNVLTSLNSSPFLKLTPFK